MISVYLLLDLFESYYNQYALKGQKLLAQGIALGSYVCKPVAL